MYATVLWFGKYRGMRLDQVSKGYLNWLLSCDNLEPWFREQVKGELASRGERFIPATPVLAQLQDSIEECLCDEVLDPEESARVNDRVLDVFDAARQRYGIGPNTELTVPGRKPQLCPCCQESLTRGAI